MPCIGKLFESILNNRLSFKNEVCNDNDPYQAGFKSNSRTTDNIFILCAIIDKQRCLSKPLYTCFVDFTKAFDYIDRTALYYKLLNRGIDGNLLNVIRSMFSKAECHVKWDSRISDILNSEYGVLQGGMLSPKLFTELDGIGFTNWCSRIRSVLERAGPDQIWESQNIGDTNKFMLLFKESSVRIFTQEWRKDIESSSKLRTYALVKKYFVLNHISYTQGVTIS